MLVAGIAHEINTPIGAVHSMQNTLFSALKKIQSHVKENHPEVLNDNPKINTMLKVIDDSERVVSTGTQRVAEIVRRLKSFARLDEADKKTVNIHDGLDDSLMMVHHEIKNRIDINKEYGDIPHIACYPSQLNQVFLNLFVNASQAIKEKGTITIRTRRTNGDIEIDISDTGQGIKPENIAKIFDPGFTTKGVGIGTGLGLSICYQIIQDHNGNITVQSEVGKGTTFTIRLPIN